VTKPKQDRKLSPEKLKTVVQTNLWNVINGVQVFVPEMVEHNAGHIVNIASAELLGVLGQALYLEAEAAGVRATGIGCFFDDEMHTLLGVEGHAWQSLYHFTVGGAVDDQRLSAFPPYQVQP